MVLKLPIQTLTTGTSIRLRQLEKVLLRCCIPVALALTSISRSGYKALRSNDYQDFQGCLSRGCATEGCVTSLKAMSLKAQSQFNGIALSIVTIIGHRKLFSSNWRKLWHYRQCNDSRLGNSSKVNKGYAEREKKCTETYHILS